jgi:hypothetical protein
LLFLGCNKSPSPDPNPAPDITDSVTSSTIYTPGNPTLNKDTFRFDATSRIFSISFQSLNGTAPDQTVDSGSFYFSFSSTSWQPSGYILVGRKSIDINDVTETHQLSYDTENRLILDSMISSSASGYDPKGAHYYYFDNLVVIQTYLQGNTDYSRRDSIVSIEGNFSYFSEYYLNGTDWTRSYSYNMTINKNYKNPYYSASLSKSLGAFLLYTCGIDFLSKNLTNGASLPVFTWTTDSKNRVISGSATDGSYIKYTYK